MRTRAGMGMTFLSVLLLGTSSPGAEQARVRVDASTVGPRPLEEQTRSSVVRDYLEAWQTLGSALAANRTDLLDRSFVGLASQELAATVEEQRKIGLQSVYRDLSHKIRLVFYSPEGMSIQLVDDVEYEVQVLQNGRLGGAERVHSRYISVLTPTEVRWKVRILQAAPE
ncbi:MAG: hypothetical protein JO159_15940 [Acidobacteria bacterium]|nr:hypothetical protein [Acidobacteriota bacterium]MBV9623796.1 hypothetical protein [Acidobacteriota bacterium]